MTPAAMHQPSAVSHLGLSRACLVLAVGTMVLAAGCSPSSQEPLALAIVNGKPITESEFEFRWSELSETARARYNSEGGKRKFLDELIARELLLQEARKRGLDQSPEFRERLERVKERLMLEELMKEAVKVKVELSDDEVEAYYASRADALPDAEGIRVAQIVVPTLAEARYLKKQLENGADFAKLAQRFSTDQATKAKGGDLGVYRKGSGSPEFEAALLALKPGMVSGAIKTDSGVFLVKMISRTPVDPQTLQAARDRLRREVYAEKQRKRFEEFIAELKTTANIRIADTPRSATDEANRALDVPNP